jgi:hypothetical protein
VTFHSPKWRNGGNFPARVIFWHKKQGRKAWFRILKC